jgi:site-specific recombinase XerD
MKGLIQRFTTYLRIERNASPATISAYRPELEKFLLYLLANDIEEIKDLTVSVIREYIYNIKEERNLSSVSTYTKIAIIKSFFNFLASDGIIDKNPAVIIKLPRRERPIPKFVPESDFRRLTSCIKFSPSRCRKNYIRDMLIFYMLYYCGLRKGDLLALDWDDIDMEKDILTVKTSKNRTGRIVPIHSEVKGLLDTCLAQRLPIENRALFIGEKGNRLCKATFTNMLNTYLKISGLKKKGYSAHSLRHSFATRLIEKNVNLFLVQRLLGHKSLDATKVYVHFDRESYKEAIEVL